ncbi:MAG: glycosyltransferase family 39 protein [Pyrinomonadaceae bacterium]
MNTDELKLEESEQQAVSGEQFKVEDQNFKTENRQKNIFRSSMSDSFWLAGCAVITVIAAFLRFFWLELKPFHHDEGVNGFFLTNLFREGIYKYDPTNYHGPDLYYFALAFSKIFGLNTFSVRSSVAIFGVLTVVLAFCLKRYIGAVGSLTAALFLALSPGMVYVSRYFIHEMSFVFFSFGIVVGVLYFIEKRKAGIFAVATMSLLLLVCFLPTAINLASLVGTENVVLLWVARIGAFFVEAVLVFLIMRVLVAWKSGTPIYLMLASASAILLFATKETAFITIGTMLIAVLCVWLWRKIYRVAFREPIENEIEPVELNWRTFRSRLGNWSNLFLIFAAVSIVFAYVGVLFFSSFFTYAEGVPAAFKAYAFWTKTGTGDHTQNGFWGYLWWGMKIEAPIMILAAVGTVIAFAKARHRFAMFAGLWAFGLFAAYSIIPYKTPWLALSFLLPMCFCAGYSINELVASRHFRVRILGGVLAVTAIAVLGYQTYDLNFQRYDDDQMPYVYAHTKRGFLNLIKNIEFYAEKSGRGKDASIEVVSPDYWSMPWYLRDYPKAVFHGTLIDTSTAEIIVGSEKQISSFSQRYGANYRYAGIYPLRPGVELYLLVRKDLADPNTRDIPKIEVKAP